MKTTKTILYSLTVAATSFLAPLDSAKADDPSQWECLPSKDFRSWVCLKDGQPPVEPDVPRAITETPTPVKPADGVEVTPLAEPQSLEPVAPVETTPQVADQPPAPEAIEPSEKAIAETPEPEKSPVEPAPTTAAQEEKPLEPETPVATSEIIAPETPVAAADTSDLIRIDNSLPSCVVINRSHVIPVEDREEARKNADTHIEADEATVEKDTITTLTGNVKLRRADQTIVADQVTLNKETDEADAKGNLVYTDSELELQADQGHMDLDADENTFDNVSYTTLEQYARGTATQVRTYQGKQVELDNAQYTSCPPGNNTWLITADNITLDDETGRGTAENAKLEFFDIPVFYAPYINFPIDDRRQTGMLTPRFGRSDDRGTEITAPIYWNIAPDKDATFYPRYMSKRGLQLGGEFRYLNDNNYGQVNLEYLDSDDEYNDKDRWGFKFEHDATIFNGWDIETQVKRVSDKEYFEDLGSSLALSSQRHLESHLKINKRSKNWRVYGLLQDFQTIDSTIAVKDRPYERLPHIKFDAWTDTFGGGFKARIKTQYTDFDHESPLLPTAKRTTLYPSITYSHETAGYYIRPKLGVHYTKYSLDNQGALPSSPDRSIPVFSVDTGLFYERRTDLLGKSMLQTLEPRIYYLNVGEENQDDIPIFDTSIWDFNSSSLFRENRFSGLDRIGDTNQLSVGITSRFLDPDSGTERLSLTFGQIYYFSDRDVTLPGDKKDDDDSSPIIAEIKYRPYDSLIASALIHWDPETSKTERTIYRMKYQPDDHRILNLSYRFREDSIKQTDVSFLWPITQDNRWHAVGRWNHSLRHEKTLDILAGLEYESCCWKTRFVARRWLNDVNGDHDTGIFFEVELKGLGSIGDDITGFLETGILGYDRHIKDEDDDTYYY